MEPKPFSDELETHIRYIDEQAKMCEMNPSLAFIEQLRRRIRFLLYDDNSPIAADRKQIAELEKQAKIKDSLAKGVMTLAEVHEQLEDAKITIERLKLDLHIANRALEINIPTMDLRKRIAEIEAENKRLRDAIGKLTCRDCQKIIEDELDEVVYGDSA